MRKFALALIALALALLPAWYSGATSGRADGGPNPPIADRGIWTAQALSAPGQISVRFKPGVSDAAINNLHARHGARLIEKQPLSGVQRLALPPGASLDQILAPYRKSPLVAEANVTHTAQLFDYPNDTNYPYQWHLHSTGGGVWADVAWALAPNGGAGVVAAGLDTGAAYAGYNGPPPG